MVTQLSTRWYVSSIPYECSLSAAATSPSWAIVKLPRICTTGKSASLSLVHRQLAWHEMWTSLIVPDECQDLFHMVPNVSAVAEDPIIFRSSCVSKQDTPQNPPDEILDGDTGIFTTSSSAGRYFWGPTAVGEWPS